MHGSQPLRQESIRKLRIKAFAHWNYKQCCVLNQQIQEACVEFAFLCTPSTIIGSDLLNLPRTVNMQEFVLLTLVQRLEVTHLCD